MNSIAPTYTALPDQSEQSSEAALITTHTFPSRADAKPAKYLAFSITALRIPVQLLIHAGIPEDSLHVLARLGKRNRLDKFLRVPIIPCRQPVLHPVRTGIVSGQRVLEGAELIHHAPEIPRAELQIHSRYE